MGKKRGELREETQLMVCGEAERGLGEGLKVRGRRWEWLGPFAVALIEPQGLWDALEDQKKIYADRVLRLLWVSGTNGTHTPSLLCGFGVGTRTSRKCRNIRIPSCDHPILKSESAKCCCNCDTDILRGRLSGEIEKGNCIGNILGGKDGGQNARDYYC